MQAIKPFWHEQQRNRLYVQPHYGVPSTSIHHWIYELTNLISQCLNRIEVVTTYMIETKSSD